MTAFKNTKFSVIAVCIACSSLQAQVHDTLFARFLVNKEVPAAYTPEFAMALSYFPELSQIHIVTKEKNIRTVMAARPSFLSFFRKPSKRTYFLIIDTLHEKGRGLFYLLPVTARVGLIGHELAHVTDYHRRKAPALAGYGIAYCFNKKKIEHRTDEIAMAHGLLSQLYDYARLAFDPAFAGEKYCRYKKKYYYSPGELLQFQFHQNGER